MLEGIAAVIISTAEQDTQVQVGLYSACRLSACTWHRKDVNAYLPKQFAGNKYANHFLPDCWVCHTRLSDCPVVHTGCVDSASVLCCVQGPCP